MKNKLNYSFDDEVVSKFCYDMDNKKIEVHFTGYFDLANNKYFDTPCIWVIENWKEAKSKMNSEALYDSLETNMGIFSMILSIETVDKNLKITVNTLDNRYIDLVFIEPNMTLI